VREGDSEIESLGGVFLKIRRALGATAFGINEVRLPPGAAGREHDEADTGHEEVYVCLAGAGTFTVAGEDVTVAPGDYLLVPPGTARQPVAGPDGLRFVVVGGPPQAAYGGRESL
jgi:quercetin dioxygenase-like cupin family protein